MAARREVTGIPSPVQPPPVGSLNPSAIHPPFPRRVSFAPLNHQIIFQPLDLPHPLPSKQSQLMTGQLPIATSCSPYITTYVRLSPPRSLLGSPTVRHFYPSNVLRLLGPYPDYASFPVPQYGSDLSSPTLPSPTLPAYDVNARYGHKLG